MTYAVSQRLQFPFWLALILLACFGTSRAQTSAITYQGNLIYNGAIANGSTTSLLEHLHQELNLQQINRLKTQTTQRLSSSSRPSARK